MSSSTYDIIEYLLFKVALFGYSYGFFCVFSGLVFSYATFKTKK
ncbi:hypothetical protein Xszus_00843 [Xenorhabdus szentirmaii]|nr:hypothetical protein Xszus_00843 [Xenorhabdus szentirmaii]